MFRVITERSEKDLPGLYVEHEEAERKLQPQPPRYRCEFDRTAIGGEQIGEAENYRDAQHPSQTSHAVNLFPSRDPHRRESIAHRHPKISTRPTKRQTRGSQSCQPTVHRINIGLNCGSSGLMR